MYFILHSEVMTTLTSILIDPLLFLYSTVYHSHTIILKQNYHLVLKSQDKHTAAMQGESSSAHTGQRLPEEVSRAGLIRGLTSASPGGDKALSEELASKTMSEFGVSQVLDMPEAWSVRVGCSVSSISEPTWSLPALGGKQKTSVSDMCVLSRA